MLPTDICEIRKHLWALYLPKTRLKSKAILESLRAVYLWSRTLRIHFVKICCKLQTQYRSYWFTFLYQFPLLLPVYFYCTWCTQVKLNTQLNFIHSSILVLNFMLFAWRTHFIPTPHRKVQRTCLNPFKDERYLCLKGLSAYHAVNTLRLAIKTSLLIMHTAKVYICSEIHTKHINAMESPCRISEC